MAKHLILIILVFVGATRVSAEPISITVLPFTAVDGEQYDWLGKGIADIFIRNLAEFDQFRVVDRGQLQAYLREMELQGSAFTDTDKALRVARVAKVERILIGSFRVFRGKFDVEVVIVDLDSAEITQTLNDAGLLEDLHAGVPAVGNKEPVVGIDEHAGRQRERAERSPRIAEGQ